MRGLAVQPLVSVIATTVNAASIVVHRRLIVWPNTQLVDYISSLVTT
jgi:hypothetical protein